ncbi:hypothetical protein [Burkholderia cenocepacia]|uniref:hypothetical protein n=1 Tax=Burkholderia cenocepacia TaxID=95486 RepID=UPI00097BC742|nr:hypothetical protein [Burkholderia cenocepacia]ONJ19592.1 hypothetical protein A8D82_11780 [Burkholderia cenocepacia]ONN83428.1 hypothetical protein A8D63_25985 [Burkholderia cenocepacia]ONN85909.1 hypothetical protein A8D64_19355 [Burkholderia cenocepacia]ONN95049.1 hypothetical protein A8D62_09710 [Burkholderia cenocepacia]ONO06645.1 hypothetical protein A8D67_19265 [Burkholderia cenocepacia]
MAKVTLKKAVTQVIEPEKVVMELTREEAEAVHTVLGRVIYSAAARVERLENVFNALKHSGIRSDASGVTGYVTLTA